MVVVFCCFRILGFYRVPPTAGREVNLTSDIKRLAESKLKKTFFISPGTLVMYFKMICEFLTRSESNKDGLKLEFFHFWKISIKNEFVILIHYENLSV